MSSLVHESLLGAEVLAGHGTRFRVWAPRRESVEVVVENPDGSRRVALELASHEDGHYSGFFAGLKPGVLYRYALDVEGLFPDPASRFQPSRVVEPRARFGTGTGDDRLLLVNLDDAIDTPAAEPLLAPPAGLGWIPLWSSDDPRYGGAGAALPHDRNPRRRLPARTAFVPAPLRIA